MSFTYTYENVVVQKIPAFESYILKGFALATATMVEATIVHITTSAELDSTQQTELETLVRAYVDPEIFYQFTRAESITGWSQSTSSATAMDVQSFIFPSKTLPNGDNAQSDGTILNALKSILVLSMEDVAQAVNFTSGSVTIELFDVTRNIQIGTQTIDISATLLDWKAAAEASETGPVNKYRCFMFSGMGTAATNYDCIWVFRLSITEPMVHARLNGFQKLFYTPI